MPRIWRAAPGHPSELARLLLPCFEIKAQSGTTQVFGNRSGKLVRNAIWATALACAALALGSVPRASLDIALRSDSGHALLRFGFASIRLAFDFGQRCSESNAPCGARL